MRIVPVADAARAQDLTTLERVAGLIGFASDDGFTVDLRHVQHRWHAFLRPPG